MQSIDTEARQRLSTRSVRLQMMFACSLSILAIIASASSARAQQGQGQLPTVPVEPPAVAQPKQAAPQAAAKRTAPVAKAQPKQTPPPQPPAAVTPPDPATALGSYNPALDLRGYTPPPGTTLTTAGPVQGYRALSAMSSTKTATPLEQIPQSIQVIPKSVLQDQTSLTVNETVRNASNVQSFNDLNIGNTDMAGAKICGFKAEQWLDGMGVNYNTGDRDALANVERIEVLKGPSAILYGGGSGAPAGGAINVISKLPTDRASGEFGITVGSHRFARPYFDINQPLTPNGTVLFRMTGEYTSSDSFVDILEQDRYSINPTLTLTNKSDTTLTIQARKSRFTQQAYPGLPAVGTIAGDFRINRHQYVGDPNIPRSFTEVEGVTVTFDHKLDPIWSFNVKTRFSKSEFDQKSQGPFGAAPDSGPTRWALYDFDIAQQQQEFSINPNVQARFDWGATRNKLLVGADYSKSTDRGHMNTNFFGSFFGTLPVVDLLNPVYTVPYADPNPSSPTFFPFFDFENVYKTKGVYGQLQTTVFDRIHLMGGLRWANIEVEYLEKAVADPLTFALSSQLFTVDESKVLPRAGVVVDIIDGVSVYASYSEGMRWAGFNQALEVKPEFHVQKEAGFKLKLNNQLSGTIAVFDIERSNIPVISGGYVASLTDQHAKGYEVDLIWQPNRNWQMLANYAHTEAEFSSGARAGNKVHEVPADLGRVWVNYMFDPGVLKGWSIGAGIYAASSSFVDPANLYRADGYFTIDSKVAYETETFRASFNVKNVTNEQYFVPYAWLDGQVAPGPDRAFYGTVAIKY